MREQRRSINWGRFHRIFTSYLIISLVPLLLGLVVFQRAIDNLEDSVFRFHHQLLSEYRQVTDAKLSGVQNTVLRLTWDDQVMEMGRAAPLAIDPAINFIPQEVSRRLEKIVALESGYLDLLVYADASGTVATSQFSFVSWDRFYDVFFKAEGMTSTDFLRFLREQRTLRLLPMTVQRFTGGRWTTQEVLLHAMDFPIAGTPMGKVVALVSVGDLMAPAEKLRAQGVETLLIADTAGRLIASMGDLPEGAAAALLAETTVLPPGQPEILTLDGQRMLAIVEPSQGLDLRYISFVAYDNLFGVVLSVRNAMYVLLGVSTLLVICSAALLARRQTNQFSHLALKAGEMEQWLDAQKASLAGLFLDRLLRDEFTDVQEAQDFALRIGLPWLPGAVVVVVIRLDETAPAADPAERIDLAKLLLRNLLTGRAIPHYIGNLDDRRMALLLGGAGSEPPSVPVVEALIAEASALVGDKLAVEITGVASDQPVEVTDAHLTYRQCRHTLDYTRGPGLFWLRVEPERQDALWYPLSQEEQILAAVRKGNAAQLDAALGRVRRENWEARALPPAMYRQLVASLRGTVLRGLQACEDPAPVAEDLLATLSAVEAEASVSVAFDQLAQCLAQLAEAARRYRTGRGSQQVASIVAYIDAQYGDSSLSLTSIAAHFGLSEPYVSRVFKETTGVNYSEYVEGKRIAQACALLQAGRPIQEVAQAVGYNSVSVFRNAFKRVMGMTPGAYEK